MHIEFNFQETSQMTCPAPVDLALPHKVLSCQVSGFDKDSLAFEIVDLYKIPDIGLSLYFPVK